MKINLKELSTQKIESTTGAKKMRLSENAQSMVFQMFTKNIYSNPIGTIVREITSNCFDSHIEAGIDAPVRIKKSVDKETNTTYISFIDYGVGMCPDRVENIYGVYFESTKRDNNDEIGGFGIGGKTPLAYKRPTGQGEGEYDNSFYVITIYNGTKYYYCIYEGADAPEISLLHSENTTERNGTEIRIPVLDKDVYDFTNEMKRQLYYFENIIFEGFDNDESMNDYQIVRGKTFLFRGDEYNNAIHVCLGKVAYPIDYSILGLSSSDYYLPIAIKLNIGDINVTASREGLDYSKKTIQMLKEKLDEVKSEILSLVAKQYDEITTLEDYFNVKNNFGYLYFKNGMSMKVSSVIDQRDISFNNFKYSFMKMPNDKQLFSLFFDAKLYGKKPSKSRWSNNDFVVGYEGLKNSTNLYYVDGDFTRKVIKQSYLKSIHETYYIITKREIVDSSRFRTDIAELFNTHVDSIYDSDDTGTAKQLKPIVTSILELRDEYFEIIRNSRAINYDDVEVPDDFIMSKKQNKITDEIRNTSIPVNFAGQYGKARIKLDVLFKLKANVFYGTSDDELELRNASEIFELLFDKTTMITYYDEYRNTFERSYSNSKTKKGIMFIKLAKNNVKYMEYCKKAYPISQFYNKILRRKEEDVLNYFRTYPLVSKRNEIEEFYKSSYLSNVSPKWHKKIVAIENYFDVVDEKYKSYSMSRYELTLKKVFSVDNVQQTAEQKKINKLMDDIIELQQKNQKIMQYISLPYRMDRADDELFEILKKVMVLP